MSDKKTCKKKQRSGEVSGGEKHIYTANRQLRMLRKKRNRLKPTDEAGLIHFNAAINYFKDIARKPAKYPADAKRA